MLSSQAVMNPESPPVPEAFSDSPEFHRLLAGEERPSLVHIAPGDRPRRLPRPRCRALSPQDRSACRACGHAMPPRAKPRNVLGQINWALFVEEGFEGNRDDYFDPRNSYLNEVIDRKKGSHQPSVLYAGSLTGLAFDWKVRTSPRTSCSGSTTGIHLVHRPLPRGRVPGPPGLRQATVAIDPSPRHALGRPVAPCPARVIVARMLRNLKAIYLQTGNYLSRFMSSAGWPGSPATTPRNSATWV